VEKKIFGESLSIRARISARIQTQNYSSINGSLSL
jgi:hypothetical protein